MAQNGDTYENAITERAKILKYEFLWIDAS